MATGPQLTPEEVEYLATNPAMPTMIPIAPDRPGTVTLALQVYDGQLIKVVFEPRVKTLGLLHLITMDGTVLRSLEVGGDDFYTSIVLSGVGSSMGQYLIYNNGSGISLVESVTGLQTDDIYKGLDSDDNEEVLNMVFDDHGNPLIGYGAGSPHLNQLDPNGDLIHAWPLTAIYTHQRRGGTRVQGLTVANDLLICYTSGLPIVYWLNPDGSIEDYLILELDAEILMELKMAPNGKFIALCETSVKRNYVVVFDRYGLKLSGGRMSEFDGLLFGWDTEWNLVLMFRDRTDELLRWNVEKMVREAEDY